MGKQKIMNIFNNETKLVVSDHSILLTVVIAPLLYAFFLGSIYLFKDIEQIRVAVVDYDNTPTTRRIVREISAVQKIDLVGYFNNYDEGVQKLKELEIEGFILFDNGFEKRLLKHESAYLNLYLNTTRFLPSNDINLSINEVILAYGANIRLKYYELMGIPHQKAEQLIVPVDVEIKPIYNTTNNYGDFLLPGLFFLILQQTLLIGLGESVSRDNQHKLFGKINGSLTEIANYVIGKSLYYLVLYISYLVIFTTVVFPFFDIPVAGSVTAIFFVSIVFILTIIFLTVLIGSMVSSQIRMMEIMAFTSYPFFLLSGYSWPIVAMPAPLQWLSYVIPTTPMMEAMKRLIVMGGELSDIVYQLSHLSILLIIYSILTIWRLKLISKNTEQKGFVLQNNYRQTP